WLLAAQDLVEDARGPEVETRHPDAHGVDGLAGEAGGRLPNDAAEIDLPHDALERHVLDELVPVEHVEHGAEGLVHHRLHRVQRVVAAELLALTSGIDSPVGLLSDRLQRLLRDGGWEDVAR